MLYNTSQPSRWPSPEPGLGVAGVTVAHWHWQPPEPGPSGIMIGGPGRAGLSASVVPLAVTQAPTESRAGSVPVSRFHHDGLADFPPKLVHNFPIF